MSAILDTLRETLRASPESWQFRLAMVEALIAEDLIDDAAEVLAEAPGLPADLPSQIKAARAVGLLDPAQGIQILEPILQSEPTCAAAHLERAFLSHRIGDSATAKRHYFTALTFDPALEDARFELELDEAPPVASAPAPAEVSSPIVSDPDRDQEPLEVSAVFADEPDSEFATPVPIVSPEPVTPDPTTEAQESIEEPKPVGFQVQSLRSALETRSIKVLPLVRPESIPPPPELVHEQHPQSQVLAHTGLHKRPEDLHNVYVHPVTLEEAVVYDYQDPDESLFATSITPDDIYVAAPESEYQQGESFSSLLLNQRRRDLQLARQRFRNKIGAAFTGVMAMGALALILWMIKLVIPESKPPEIIATTASNTPEKSLKKKVVVRQVNKTPAPPSAAAPMPFELITSATASTVAVPSVDSPDSVDLQLGTSFGAGSGFGSAPGMGGGSGTFFGSSVSGGMAVIFDITGSMYGANPRVVTEINRKFRSAQVVAVFGATFRDVGSDELVPYKKNEEVLANVDKNGKKSATQLGMNKALFSLSQCDSLSAKGWEIQSLGKAIEALLNQPASKQPRTIFIFSDFQDGIDLAYMEKVQELVRRRRAKIVFYHPVAFTRDETHYREFAKLTKGEVKEGLPK